VAPILIALMLIGLSAAVGGWLMQKVGQPAVLGELLVGIVIGNVAYWFREPIITVVREGDLARQSPITPCGTRFPWWARRRRFRRPARPRRAW